MSDQARGSNDLQSPGGTWQIPAELLEIARDGGADIVRDLFAIFQQDSASRLDALRDAIHTAEPARIRLESHSLKGSAAQVGANAMAELCRKMEQLPPQANQSARIGLLQEIELSFTRFQKQFSEAGLEHILAREEIRR